MTSKGRLCYVSHCYRGLDTAGYKAKVDNEVTLEQMGAVNLGLPRRFSKNAVKIFIHGVLSSLRFCFTVRRGDMVVLQYPLKKYFTFICLAAHWRHAHVAALIHDLGAFRRKKLTVAQEMRRLSHADGVIASNEVMEAWLRQHGYQGELTSLGFWDYHSPSHNQHVQTAVHHPVRIAYAGSISQRKNAFLLAFAQRIENTELHLVGWVNGMPELEQHPKVVCHGFMADDAFIANADVDFGIVWDGDALDECRGDWGEYLRLNTPHKTSFYLRAGIPVVVWKSSAMAHLVERYGVGLCIDSLETLEDTLLSLSAEQYAEMKKNALAMADKMNRGGFVREAVERMRHKL